MEIIHYGSFLMDIVDFEERIEGAIEEGLTFFPIDNEGNQFLALLN